MRAIRLLAATVIAAGAMFIGAPTASASCQTNPDVGDVCKVLDVACRTKPGAYLQYCR